MKAADAEQLASHHYFDRESGLAAVKLLPGEYYITSEDMVLTTVLGSCVSACIRDSTVGIGGMNHFMLPDEADPSLRDTAATMRYGAYAMEVLIYELLKAGARRERLEAKVFGGGAVLANMTLLNIGERNANFVLRYLQLERIRIAAQDLRGKLPRRINFFPRSGKVTVRKLRQQDDALQVQRAEQEMARAMLIQRDIKQLELVDNGLARHFISRSKSTV
ncbi:MAG: chemoreceptor glutamine deamidase CheD [Polaromonas sp.]